MNNDNDMPPLDIHNERAEQLNSEALTVCPICGEELQSTVETWYSGLALSSDGKRVISHGEATGRVEPGEGTYRVYCANDHTHEAIIKSLAKFAKFGVMEFELNEQLESAIEQDSPRSAAHIEDVIAGKTKPDDWLVEWIKDARE